MLHKGDPYDEIREILLEVFVHRDTADEVVSNIKDIIAYQADRNKRVSEALNLGRAVFDQSVREFWEPLLYATKFIIRAMDGKVACYDQDHDEDGPLWMLDIEAMEDILGLDTSSPPDDDGFNQKACDVASHARMYLTAVLAAAERTVERAAPMRGRKGSSGAPLPVGGRL